MQHSRRLVAVIVWTVALAAAALGQTVDPMEAVCTVSQDLTAYTAQIRMTQHQGQDGSEIEFTFDYVPADRMHIVYTAPATVEGQTVILNGDQFYTYIPSLNRNVWQNAGEGGSNPGEEMGFLYDFVTREASTAMAQAAVQVEESLDTFELENSGEVIDVAVLTIVTDEQRQEVLLNVLDGAPVAISIYHGDDLKMEIRVLDYQINGAVDEAKFVIPEQ